MAKYTIDDIEILRQKSGVSYEEAVDLLEYHNGSLARALLDLEKNGRIKTEKNSSDVHKGIKGAFSFLYRLRLKIQKGDIPILNISSLFVLLTLLVAPHICVIGLILCLVLGYRISVERNSRAFASETFDSILKSAKTNVHNTVSRFTQQFFQNDEGHKAEKEKSTPQPRAEGPASGTKPVHVQFSDGGSVDVRDGGDGYHEADID